MSKPVKTMSVVVDATAKGFCHEKPHARGMAFGYQEPKMNPFQRPGSCPGGEI
jgi:hypothetical protein